MISKFSNDKKDDSTRVNHQIRCPRVRVINPDGELLGIMPTSEAIAKAMEMNLDLVEVSPNADPPVCKIMNFGKFKYEKSKKAKIAKKKQHVMHLKEIKLHPQTEEHDLNFKLEHAKKFLLRGDRVKFTVVFRGREIAHIDFGKEVLEKVNESLQEIALIEQPIKMEGKNLSSVYIPDKAKIKEYLKKIEAEKKKEENILPTS